MYKIILTISLFLSASVAHAERQVLYFHFEGCPYCPAAKDLIKQPDMSELVLQYDDNFSVDTKIYPQIVQTFRPALQNRQGKVFVPNILIVEVEKGDDTYKSAKVLYVWHNTGKNTLKNALIKYSPKSNPVLFRQRPLLKRIFEAVK